MKRWMAYVAMMATLMVGCRDNSQAPATSTSSSDNGLSIVDGVTPTDSEKEKLLAAKEKLVTRLTDRLMSAMSKNGPAKAIEICQVEAKSIAKEVGKEANVSIGRTGVRLRNTSNQPPTWAQGFVAEKRDTPVFAKLSNEHAVALLPIKLQPQCLMCHGPIEQLGVDVKEKLAKAYPDDRATGFSEGELRGWIWVELQD